MGFRKVTLRETHTRTLPVEVSQEERDDAARVASTNRVTANKLENEIRAYTTPRKETIKELEAEALKLETVSVTGKKPQAVKVGEVWDEQRQEIFLVRADTGETIDGPRKMTADELQRLRQPDLFVKEVGEEVELPDLELPNDEEAEPAAAETGKGKPKRGRKNAATPPH